MLTRLEYTVKIATNKFHELQDLGDKIQTNMASMFKQHFKELTPDPEAEDDTDSIHITPYKNLASIGHVKISGRKQNIQWKNATSIINKGDNKDQGQSNNPNTIRNNNGKNKSSSQGTNNKNAYSVLKTSIKGMQTKESRRPSQDETLKVFHPKQAIWNGDRTKLRSYIQQWHTQFKGLSDKKAITSLHKCLPPPYTDFIQDSPTLMDCLQILEKFCVKETSIDSGNVNNPHKRNNRIQRQDPNLTGNQKMKKEHVGKKSSTIQQINQLQWYGQRSTLVN